VYFDDFSAQGGVLLSMIFVTAARGRRPAPPRLMRKKKLTRCQSDDSQCASLCSSR